MDLAGKILLSKLKVWESSKTDIQWFRGKQVFFILGLGRSGTNFFSHLLNQDDRAVIFHEPISEDFEAAASAQRSSKSALEYLKVYRIRKMRHLVSDVDFDIYGEANSALRFHADALRLLLPECKLIHLVRDGRDVVRSIMARKHYTDNAAGHHNLYPLADDPLFSRWEHMDRFEKICWLWKDANQRLANTVTHRVRFEDLTTDYDYFNRNIELSLNLRIGEEKWRQYVAKPTNVTKNAVLPPWEEWENSLMDKFNAICGEQMQLFGYY